MIYVLVSIKHFSLLRMTKSPPKAKENNIFQCAKWYKVFIFKKYDKFLAFYSAYFITKHQNQKY